MGNEGAFVAGKVPLLTVCLSLKELPPQPSDWFSDGWQDKMVGPVKGEKKRMVENFPSLGKETDVELLEGQIPNKRNPKRPTTRHYN